jgi:hypothetical protein
MKIVLGTFKDNADELAEFLGPRVGAKAVVNGGEIEFGDEDVKKTIKPRHVKTYVKRFLNRKGERANYQILVEGGELRMIELEKEEEEEKEEMEKEREKKKVVTPPKKEEEGGEGESTAPKAEEQEEEE